jgi:uncharacterized protein
MLQFEGVKDFSRPPAEVFARLTDASFLAECMPGVESVKEADRDRAVCVLRPSFTFVRGTLEGTLQIVDRVAPTSARLLLHSKGIGSTSDVEAALRLEPQGTGTRMHWSAQVVQLGGLLKALPPGLVKGSAEKILTDAWVALETKMGEQKA